MTPEQYAILNDLAAADPVAQAYVTDALLNVPSAAGGATQGAGWAAVKAAISRIGTRAEMALATGAGTQASPATPAWEGILSASEASTVRVA